MEKSEQRKQQRWKTVKNSGQRKKKMDNDKEWWKTQITENDGEWPPIRFRGPTPPACSRASQRVPRKYKNHKEFLQNTKTIKSAWKFQMSSSKICHWQNETLHETVIIWNCTSMSSFKPLPLQLESGFRPLPVPQSLPCSPFFTTKWSALDWGGKVKDELQENKGTTRNKTRKGEQRQEPIVLERSARLTGVTEDHLQEAGPPGWSFLRGNVNNENKKTWTPKTTTTGVTGRGGSPGWKGWPGLMGEKEEKEKENCCGRTGWDQRLYKRSSLT